MPDDPERPRVVHLSTRFPPGPGGVERHVDEVTRRLVPRGFRVGVFTTELYREYPWERLDPAVPRHETRRGVDVHRLRAWSMPGELHYPFVRGLRRALATDRPDLLHAHTYGTHHAAAARHHARRFRVPFVLTAHYHPIWSIEGGRLRHAIRRFYDRRLAAPIVADAARLIVQSREEERLIRVNGFPLPRTELIPPGYTPLPEPPEGDRPFSTMHGLPGPFVLFVGRLASNKGLLELVDAFQSVARHDATSTLVLVGEDGGMRRAVERRIAGRGLESRVRLTGFLTDERMLAAAFREARVTVLPSEYEAFGLVLLESLAQGTPVIASRVGGVPEFIEDGKSGLLVPPLHVAPLAEALLALWDDEPRRRAMGAYGRDVTVPRYSWDAVADRLAAVYREVLGG